MPVGSVGSSGSDPVQTSRVVKKEPPPPRNEEVKTERNKEPAPPVPESDRGQSMDVTI